MIKTIRICILMFFLCSTPHSFGSSPLSDLNTLMNNPADLSHNMPLFIQAWKETCKNLKQNAPNDQKQEGDHLKLSFNFMCMLLNNYNKQGVQFFSRYGDISTRLNVAHSYFNNFVHFNAYNQPNNTYDLLLLSAQLYLKAFMEIRSMQEACLQNLHEAYQANQKLIDLNFSCLLYSQKTKMNSDIKCLINGHRKSAQAYDELRLKDLTPPELFVIKHKLYFGMDISTPHHRVCAAWCTYHILGDRSITRYLYRYEQNLSRLRKIQIPTFEAWLSEAAPYMTIHAQDT